MADESKAPQSPGSSEPEVIGSSPSPSGEADSPTFPAKRRVPLQSIADALRLLLKEDLIPENADRFIFWIAPLISMVAAITSLGAVFGLWFQVARDINIGLLLVVGVSALNPLGIILGGWAVNSRYSIFGALRCTAQIISYGTAAGFALVSGLLLAGSLNVRAIVEAQRVDQAWYVFLAPVGFFTYCIASIAQANHASFDFPRAASELLAGYEYRGFRWALYFLAEYANMIVIAAVGTTLFLGGWLRPFPNVRWLAWLDATPTVFLAAISVNSIFRAGKQPGPARRQSLFMWAVAIGCFIVAAIFALAMPFGHLPLEGLHDGLYGAFWFLLKVSAYLYIFMLLRIMLSRVHFDQHMRLGWHILIPLALINVVDVGIALALSSEFGVNRWGAMVITTGVTLGAAMLLVHWNDKHSAAASTALMADSSIVEDTNAG